MTEDEILTFEAMALIKAADEAEEFIGPMDSDQKAQLTGVFWGMRVGLEKIRRKHGFGSLPDDAYRDRLFERIEEITTPKEEDPRGGLEAMG
jgi:hypothetical protein